MDDVFQILSQQNGPKQPAVLTQHFPQQQQMVVSSPVTPQGGNKANLPQGGNQENLTKEVTKKTLCKGEIHPFPTSLD